MSYSVQWLPAVEQELTEIWLSASDRPLVTEAAAEIDRTLRFGPIEAGESRSEELRIFYAPPLDVRYVVFADERIVRVAAVWCIRKRSERG